MKFRLVAAMTFALGLVACGGGGGDDDDDGNNIDAPTAIDAAVNVDAAPAMGIGQPCTGNGQGDCPTGFMCLNLEGASGPWCSKTCTSGAGDMCSQGYGGPGIAACILQVTPQGGGTAMNFCGVVCADEPGDANDYCPGCNMTCPGTMVCDAPLNSNSQPPTRLATGCR